MLLSMTGFGRSTAVFNQNHLAVEMKSVNHRYFDVTLNIPPQFYYLEDRFQKVIRQYISRGKIYLYINENGTPLTARQIKTDWDLVRQYREELEKMADFYNIDGRLTFDHILQLPDVFKVNETPLGDEALEDRLCQAVEDAARKLVEMRKTEGEHLNKDMTEKLTESREKLQELTRYAPNVVSAYRDRLTKRMREYLAEEYEVDQERILNEVAVFADKANIDEEITRLNSHIGQFFDIMDEHEPKGRKLDFLIQEMNREINTIGSKGNDAVISQCVVDIKSSIEKLREQVQNVE